MTSLSAPLTVSAQDLEDRTGYDPAFLGVDVPLPLLERDLAPFQRLDLAIQGFGPIEQESFLALQVGAQVGPASGQSQPWGVLGWAAHHARLVVPAVVALVTAGMLLLSRHSPLVVIVKIWGRRMGGRRRSSMTA